jgi:hypothetical protein
VSAVPTIRLSKGKDLITVNVDDAARFEADGWKKPQPEKPVEVPAEDPPKRKSKQVSE